MAEAKQYIFDHREVAETLVKRQGIHEGIWGIYLEFGLRGANIRSGPEDTNLVPAAVIPVLKIGIQRFDEPNQLTVDAAVVNPAPKGRSSRRKGKK